MGFGKSSGKATKAASAPNSPTFIDAGCELIGELKFSDDVRIDGSVEGSIDASRTVTVGESGRIDAGLHAESVVIHGQVEGEIRVQRKVTLHKTARVSGEIHTAGIVVEEGARFRGTIMIGEDEPDFGAAKALPPGTRIENPENSES